MDKDELIKFLKENLSIKLEHALRGSPSDQQMFFVASLSLGGETISKTELRALSK